MQCDLQLFLYFPVDVFASGILHSGLILEGWACMRAHKNDIWASSNKCTGGDEVHTPRLILNNFLIAGTQLSHLDDNLYHTTSIWSGLYFISTQLHTRLFTKRFVIVSLNVFLILIPIQTPLCFL